MKYPRQFAGMAAALVLPVAALGQPKSVFMQDFTWPELKAAIAGGSDSVLLFAGSVEETGPYVAIGKHIFRARLYADEVARTLGHTLVAPIVPAVPASGPLRLFPGTINVPADVYSEYTAAIVRSLAAAGFKHIFLLGDHGGSQAPLQALAPRMTKELAVHVDFIGDGYDKATAEIEALAKSRGMNGAGHGGLWDTAETWAANSNAVRPNLFQAAGPKKNGGLDADGVQGDPRPATPELGREFGAIRVRDAVAEIRATLAREATP
jgi:creatinine amidohydrolase